MPKGMLRKEYLTTCGGWPGEKPSQKGCHAEERGILYCIGN